MFVDVCVGVSECVGGGVFVLLFIKKKKKKKQLVTINFTLLYKVANYMANETNKL